MKKIVFCTIAIFFLINTNAQVVMNINGKDISKQEFEYFYHKNNSNTSSNYISLDEYVDLFINFKLKVADAYEQKLDTAKTESIRPIKPPPIGVAVCAAASEKSHATHQPTLTKSMRKNFPVNVLLH